ncbi:uncharacterized protein LOC135369670 [Ornithodoros turicata]|uniref:uncharacterized protein LOC135369670 n=1 Tax=Ornithodoros turicata TaxID=34597 RepID=UPI003138D3CD
MRVESANQPTIAAKHSGSFPSFPVFHVQFLFVIQFHLGILQDKWQGRRGFTPEVAPGKEPVMEGTPQKRGVPDSEGGGEEKYSAPVLSSAKKLEAKIKKLEQRKLEKDVKKRLFASTYSRELFDKKVSSAVNIPLEETVYKNLTPLEFDTAAFLKDVERKANLRGRILKPRKKDPEPPLTLLETTKTYQEAPSLKNVYRPPTYSLQGAPPGHSRHLYDLLSTIARILQPFKEVCNPKNIPTF